MEIESLLCSILLRTNWKYMIAEFVCRIHVEERTTLLHHGLILSEFLKLEYSITSAVGAAGQSAKDIGVENGRGIEKEGLEELPALPGRDV
jgi:hypothetical protein